MKIKTFFMICLSLLNTLLISPIAYSQDNVAQTVNIVTDFRSIIGNPVWLLELRDVESGQVLPYIFDIKNQKNFWMAYSKERSYKIKASVLKFGPYATVNNFCHLENGILSGKSIYITITGTIAPGLKKTHCHVMKYFQPNFSVAKPDQQTTQ